jgi:hypothetical protein
MTALAAQSRRLRVRRAFATFCIALSVAGTALALPGNGATPASSTSLSFSAPYTGLVPQTGVAHIAAGCHARAGFNLTPAVRPTSGRVVTSLYDASNACPQGPAYSAQGANLGFSGPVFSPASDCTCNVSFEWRLTWTAVLRAQQLGAIFGSATSEGQMYLVDFVFDISTQSYVGYADSFFWNVIDYNGTMNFAQVNVTEWANTTAPLSASDTYELQSNLYIYFNNYCMQGSSAFGYLDLGSKGTGAQLAEMTVQG